MEAISPWISPFIGGYLIILAMPSALKKKKYKKFLFFSIVLLSYEFYCFQQYDGWKMLWKAALLTSVGVIFSYIYSLLLVYVEKKQSEFKE